VAQGPKTFSENLSVFYDKSTNNSTTGRRPFNGAVNVEIVADSVRMRLPHEIMPALNSARDGWFTLNDVFVGEKDITGTLEPNTVNRAKVRMDGMTGKLTLASGLEEFDGACNKFDTNSGQKF
jgi:hypothetical protein